MVKSRPSKTTSAPNFGWPVRLPDVLAAWPRWSGTNELDSLKVHGSNDGYYGQQAVMSTFLGNHDVPRVLSHAAAQISDMWGNGSKEQGWNNPPSAPMSEDPYKRLKMAWTFLFSQNGIPLVYYGDEIGMPGAGDPDNRRFMRFDAQLSPNERSTLEHVQILGKTRQKHSSMRTGQRRSLVNDANFWAYIMKDSNDAVLVVLNRGSSTTKRCLLGHLVCQMVTTLTPYQVSNSRCLEGLQLFR